MTPVFVGIQAPCATNVSFTSLLVGFKKFAKLCKDMNLVVHDSVQKVVSKRLFNICVSVTVCRGLTVVAAVC